MRAIKLLTILAIVSGFLFTGCNKDDGNDPDGQQTTPSVISKSPAHDATGVALGKVIKVTFSEAMNATTVNASFTLMQGTTTVAGTVATAGTVSTFTPLALLVANTVYTATVSTGAKSETGVALASNVSWTFTTGANASAPQTVDLGDAGNYVILASTAITNSPTSAITGDIAISPEFTAAITGLAVVDATGYATSSQVIGKVYAANMAGDTPANLTSAVNDMIAAHDNASTLPLPDFNELHTGGIGGKTLSPGLYKWTNSVTASSNVVLAGDANDVWIFQIAGNLSLSSGVRITLSGGALAKNIFWVVSGEATIGTTAHMEGIILSKTGITLLTDATMNGRALAQTAVILDKNVVKKPL